MCTLEKLHFSTVDDAVKLVKPGFYMAKVDLRSAYRSVNIHPSNYEATGLKWKFKGDSDYTYMFDTRLPFGSRLALSIFHRLTQSVKRMMAARGFHNVVVFLEFGVNLPKKA